MARHLQTEEIRRAHCLTLAGLTGPPGALAAGVLAAGPLAWWSGVVTIAATCWSRRHAGVDVLVPATLAARVVSGAPDVRR